MPQRISWPAALVVVSLMVCVTLLGALGQPVSELVSLGMIILGGLLYGELRSVREQTNGTQSKLLDAVTQSALYRSLQVRREEDPDAG